MDMSNLDDKRNRSLDPNDFNATPCNPWNISNDQFPVISLHNNVQPAFQGDCYMRNDSFPTIFQYP